MLQRFSFILILLTVLLPAQFSHADTYTLDQAIERAMQHNPELQATRFAQREARAGIGEARGAFFPTLQADYNYRQLENLGGSERDADYLSQDSDSLSLTLSQPLFRGMGSVAGLKKARQALQYRKYQTNMTQLRLVRDIRSSFYQFLQAQRLISKWNESIERLQQQQKIAQAWIDQELATRLRLLEIGVELSNARQQLASAQAALSIARGQLRELLVLDPDRTLQLQGELRKPGPAQCRGLDACLSRAHANRPELQMTKLDIAMARQELRRIRSRNLPQANLDASWVDYNRDFDSSQLPGEERNYYTVSLNLSFKPFQGGRNISAYRRQQATIDRLHQQQLSQRHLITTEVRTRLEQLKEGQSRLAAAETGLAEAREAYLFADRSAKLGVSSLSSLLDAELRLTRAEINRIRALNTLNQALVELDFAVGEGFLQPVSVYNKSR